VQVMLDDRRGHIRDLDLLVGGSNPQVCGGGQVGAARARPAGNAAPSGPGPGSRPGASPARLAACRDFASSPCPRSAEGGGVRPGWSSINGGNDELPEFRDAVRSSLASRSSSPPGPLRQRSVLGCQHRDELALQ
jgi:hypothetical protein